MEGINILCLMNSVIAEYNLTNKLDLFKISNIVIRHVVCNTHKIEKCAKILGFSERQMHQRVSDMVANGELKINPEYIRGKNSKYLEPDILDEICHVCGLKKCYCKKG